MIAQCIEFLLEDICAEALNVCLVNTFLFLLPRDANN